ncbi:MAG: hypothetical protein K9M81_02125, partial [Chthoniobacterales bacterium]|nr:hypothetical protein [Chthoniobacterales bacterium]
MKKNIFLLFLITNVACVNSIFAVPKPLLPPTRIDAVHPITGTIAGIDPGHIPGEIIGVISDFIPGVDGVRPPPIDAVHNIPGIDIGVTPGFTIGFTP